MSLPSTLRSGSSPACPQCGQPLQLTTPVPDPTIPCPHCGFTIPNPNAGVPQPGQAAPSGEEQRRRMLVRTPFMPGSRASRAAASSSKEPPRLPKPGDPPATVDPHAPVHVPPQPVPSARSAPRSIFPPAVSPLASAAPPAPAPSAITPGNAPAQAPIAPKPAPTPEPAPKAAASAFRSSPVRKISFARRLSLLMPVAAAALVCSAAVAAWRVWPAALFFTDTSAPADALLYNYVPNPSPPPRPPSQPTDPFEEFENEGFHFNTPADYWERTPAAASPFSLLKPAFTLRRTESSPPSEFGVGACDFALSTDLLPPGVSLDDAWERLPSVLAIQARYSCGLPERFEISTQAAPPAPGLRCLRLVWDMLPAGGGEPARHLEMWIHEREGIAWSMTGLMPGTTTAYALTRTMQRLAGGFSLLPLPLETVRLSLADRDMQGASPVFNNPLPQPLWRWTALPPGTLTWPGGRRATPGAEGLWAVGPARIALATLPPDGLQKISPTRLLAALRQIWPALRPLSIPVIDPTTLKKDQTLTLNLPAEFENRPAQAILKLHTSPRGSTIVLALIPEEIPDPASKTTSPSQPDTVPDPAALLATLDLTPSKSDTQDAAPTSTPSPLHLPLLEALAAESHADGRPEEAAAFHLSLFQQSQRLEDLASACSSLASAGKIDQASRLFDSAGSRFTHTPGWDLYRTLVLARLGAGTRAHQSAMALLSARRFPGSLAAPYLDALINSRSWPQAKAFASMLIRNDPDSPLWRLHYATILAENGEKPKAIAIIHATQQTWPEDPALGIECVQQLITWKNYQDAAACAGRVALLHPTHEQAQLILGQSHVLLGRPEEARLSYQRALKAAPSSHFARNALAALATTTAQSDSTFISPAIDPVPLPVSLTQNLPQPPASTQAPALILSRITGHRHQRGRLPATTLRSRIFITNSEGMSQWNTLTFPVNPARQRLTLHYLNVLSPAGKINARASLTDRYSLDTPDGGKLVHFPIPGLTPGSIIDYAVTTETLTPAPAWPYVHHPFALPHPCLTDICYVTGDIANLTWRHSRNTPPQETADTLIWQENQPTLLTTNVPPPNTPSLYLGTVTHTWDSIGRSYLEQIRHRLLPDPLLKETAARFTHGLTDPAAKTAALARRVRADISYTAIEFGYRAIIPNAATTTLQNRFGDCKDHAVLLHTLLTAAGIPSHLALIHSQQDPHPDFPALSQFDHMIVALPTGKNTFNFIDPTDKHLEPLPGYAPHGLADRQALILNPEKPHLTRTPAETAPSHITLQRLVTLPHPTDAQIEDHLTLTGPAAAAIRAQFAALAPAAHLTNMHRLLGLDRLREHLQDLQFTALRDPSQPLQIQLHWQARGALHPGPQNLQLHLPTPFTDYLLFPPSLTDRPDPAHTLLQNTITLQTSITVTAPDRHTLTPPQSDSTSTVHPWGSWEYTPGAPTLAWTATLRAGHYTGADATACADFPAQALLPLRQPWLLQPVQLISAP